MHNFASIILILRSICPKVFCSKCVLRIFAKFTGKHLCHSLFLAQVFSCEFCEISRSTFFYRTPPAAASVIFFWEPSHVVVNYTNVPRLRFIILIRLCIHYADRYCINLDNWNIFQQHNWHNYPWFFCFLDDNENDAVEAHIPRHRDSKTKKPRHRYSKTKKPQHRDSKTKKLRHRDSGTKHHYIEKRRQISHDIVIPTRFFRGRKDTTSRFQD